MNAFLAIWKKEVQGYFLSPVAYVTMIFFLVVMGFSFWMLATVLAQDSGGATVMGELFGSFFFWINMLVVVPVLTMRLFAEEKRSGTIETLMTAPVTDAAVVLAKYAGVLTFFIAMWLPTLVYVYVLREFSAVMAPVDPGPILGGYLGTLLVGAFYLSIGLLCSALTSNQIISAIMSFAVISVLFFCGFLAFLGNHELVRQVGGYVSSLSHMLEFSRGVLDTRPVVFYLSGTVFMLFCTIRIVESRQWK